MNGKKLNPHSKVETISKLTCNSQSLQNHFSRARIKIFTWKLNDQTSDRVSELRVHYPNSLIYAFQMLTWMSARKRTLIFDFGVFFHYINGIKPEEYMAGNLWL